MEQSSVVIEEINEDEQSRFFREVDEEIQKETKQRHRDEDYLSFRRQFDEYKRQYGADGSDSDKLKKQGNELFSLGCYEQAVLMYSEALELQHKSPVLYCNRAMAYLKQDLPEPALADAEKSLELDSEASNIKAYWRKAQALLDLGRYEESEKTSDVGLALEPANQHLNVVRRKAREASVMKRLCAWEWATMFQGVEKRMAFSENGIMTMYVFGHPVKATFDLSVEGLPRSMVVRMQPMGDVRGTGPPPPPVPYIFEFHEEDAELWLCMPVGNTELPTKFEGPGFSKLRKAPPLAAVIDSGESLDVRCAKYIAEMNQSLALFPEQLPAQPSEDQVRHEVQIAEKISKLKRDFGKEVHERAVELAKEPSLAGTDEELIQLAKGLQQRFIVRRIIAEPKVDVTRNDGATKNVASKKPNPQAIELAAAEATILQAVAAEKKATEAKSAKSEVGCLASVSAWLCGSGKSQ